MKGYVARKGNRWYAVIYEGLDPITGEDGGAGIQPARFEPTPNVSRRDWRASMTAATTRFVPSRSAST